MRRFWQPICFSNELRDLPYRVKILGEELVAFRDQSGAVGLLELHCPHRGTSLEFGLIDAKGIRCCLSRMAVRGGRDDPRDARRAGGEHPQGSALSRGLSDPRVQRYRLCPSGAARPAATVPDLRQLQPAGISAHSGPEILLSVQLAANPG